MVTQRTGGNCGHLDDGIRRAIDDRLKTRNGDILRADADGTASRTARLVDEMPEVVPAVGGKRPFRGAPGDNAEGAGPFTRAIRGLEFVLISLRINLARGGRTHRKHPEVAGMKGTPRLALDGDGKAGIAQRHGGSGVENLLFLPHARRYSGEDGDMLADRYSRRKEHSVRQADRLRIGTVILIKSDDKSGMRRDDGAIRLERRAAENFHGLARRRG